MKRNSLEARSIRLAEAACAIRAQQPMSSDRAFVTKFLVLATLPHRQPRGNPPEWCRSNGWYTLSIRPGYTTDPRTGRRVCVGYPAGSIPRLLMFWVSTEAVRTKSRHLDLGETLSEFMRELGLNPRNGTCPRSDTFRLRQQMDRLFRATISFELTNTGVHRWTDMQVAPEGELWWDFNQQHERPLWQNWIELGEKFYEAVVAHPVPLDLRALRELKNSPLALDLYAWCTYKTYQVLRKGRSQRISWRQLQGQLGADYGSVGDFRRKAKAALARVSLVYPGLEFDVVQGGVVVRPGHTAVVC